MELYVNLFSLQQQQYFWPPHLTPPRIIWSSPTHPCIQFDLNLRHDKFLASQRKLIQGLLAIFKLELEQVVDAVALITTDFDGTAPARLVKVTVLRHTTSKLGPKPRVAMVGGILALEGTLALLDTMGEGIVAVVVP